jgi:hypothetical protein
MSPLLEEVLRQAEQLAPEERLALVEKVMEGLKQSEHSSPSVRHQVSDFYGIAPNLLEGRDAQEWVNALRDEWSEREAQWNPDA